MKRKVFAVFSLLVFASAYAAAEKKNNVELKVVAEVEVKVKNERGEEKVVRVDAAKANVLPGDPVFFTINYKNLGEEPATDVVITNPVSLHMVYMDGTAVGANAVVTFSVDNGKTFAAADKLKVRDKNGKERPAVASDYTHIRWTLQKPLAKGEKGSVGFKAKVK